jgi:CheY-like chemotaxis protein
MNTQNDELRDVRILVVEDDRDTREIVQFVLEQSGAAVIGVDCVTEALKVYKEMQPDVIVADIAMPGYNGYALITQIREEEKQLEKVTPAIALTAFTSPADRETAFSAGFQEYLSKPFHPAELVATVAKLIRSGGPATVHSAA